MRRGMLWLLVSSFDLMVLQILDGVEMEYDVLYGRIRVIDIIMH